MYFVVIYLLFILSFLIVSHRSISILNSPAGASLQLVPNSEFTILSPSYLSHSSYLSHLSHLSHPFSQFKIQNSKFSPSPTIAGAARTPSPPSLLIPPTNPILPTRLTSPTRLTRLTCPKIQNS